MKYINYISFTQCIRIDSYYAHSIIVVGVHEHDSFVFIHDKPEWTQSRRIQCSNQVLNEWRTAVFFNLVNDNEMFDIWHLVFNFKKRRLERAIFEFQNCSTIWDLANVMHQTYRIVHQESIKLHSEENLRQHQPTLPNIQIIIVNLYIIIYCSLNSLTPWPA